MYHILTFTEESVDIKSDPWRLVELVGAMVLCNLCHWENFVDGRFLWYDPVDPDDDSIEVRYSVDLIMHVSIDIIYFACFII